MQSVVVAKDNRTLFGSVDNSKGDFVCGKIFPIERIDVPLYGKKACLFCHANKPIVIIPVRRAEQIRLLK